MGKRPKKYRPSAEQRELEKRQLEEQREQQSEISEREALSKRKRAGRASLLTGAQTGVKNTLG